MASAMQQLIVVLFSAALALVQGSALTASSREENLMQTWNKVLDAQQQGAEVTPITRVVNLLKEMQVTLKKEMDEDEELYDKLACWCNNNKYEKNEAIEAAEKEIERLEALIEQLTAKIAELKTIIEETTKELEADKQELAEATELRQKQLKAFHGEELDAIQNVENLKAAIIVLGKHHGGALPQISLLGLSSTLHKGKSAPGGGAEGMLDRQLDAFMLKNDFKSNPADVSRADHAVAKFLQEKNEDLPVRPIAHMPSWSAHDKAVLQKAMRTAAVFMQSKGRYTPPYASQSGEILGIMKQMKEEMEADLSEAQKTEADRAAAFDELRAAKTDEIAAGEKLLEEKKAELAQAEFDVANAKEDLEEVQAALAEDQKFLANLVKTCEEAEKNFELRKKARLEEIKAVSETIEILTSDEARDAMNGAYKFIQLSSRTRRISGRRSLASQTLRTAASRTKSSQLSVLATAVELDAFTKIKAMMDEMVQKLKIQQADEVKKNDWCKSEFQENDMQTMKFEDVKQDQTVQIEDLGTAIKTLTDEIEAAKATIAQLQIDLQRAGETRVKENHEFQMTVADQVATQEILAKALDKLATFYDKEFLVQVGRSSVRMKAHQKQTPPVAQAEYKPSGGASGVMSMIEKLIYDAKELEADAKKSESESQVAYETFIADTSASLKDLSSEVVTKSEEVSKAEKAKVETEEALQGTLTDLQDLAKYKAGLHEECDYIMKNFGIRQEGRQAEIEAIQQAKQILSGAQ
eukprot:gnl/MRDRNA2_/MRDRNA2_89211_c0_seq1.p1 gnl/MRDRNA2_/MRDRNA2_89211_c0~~gnl/MRDRNA2_/MRDRNA2_89211_c0_seq1.p1  ORF type:complete len:752 (-),score=250.54 gnl/MRDRNA2_/MRDRNA2_89211_c0_seq1:49-2304(-)